MGVFYCKLNKILCFCGQKYAAYASMKNRENHPKVVLF